LRFLCCGSQLCRCRNLSRPDVRLGRPLPATLAVFRARPRPLTATMSAWKAFRKPMSILERTDRLMKRGAIQRKVR